MLNRIFQLDQHGTTPMREFQAGLTTFVAMAYILAVNPDILANAGMDKGAVLTVTAITAAFATALMAVMSNYPIALAPGMGINAFFTFTICLGKNIPWSEALGMVFINGLIFLALSVSGLREKIICAIPHSLKIALTCGIGLFIAFIGLKNGGIIVHNPETFVSAGNFTVYSTALCLLGILLTIVLLARRIPGAIVLSIALITLLGLFVPTQDGAKVTQFPSTFFTLPQSPEPVLFKLTFKFLSDWSAFATALPLILTLLIVDMFDNIGTLLAVTKRTGLITKDGTLPRARSVLLTDSIATMASALFGTSTVVSYIESTSGVESGGRTGLTSLTTAAFFILALFFTPLILAVPSAATSPALVVVGIFMMQSVLEIDLSDFKIAAPAVLTILGIPLTFSIGEGLGLGLLTSACLALFLGQPKLMSKFGYVLAAIFFMQFFKIWPFGS